jgi:hypothetical protein
MMWSIRLVWKKIMMSPQCLFGLGFDVSKSLCGRNHQLATRSKPRRCRMSNHHTRVCNSGSFASIGSFWKQQKELDDKNFWNSVRSLQTVLKTSQTKWYLKAVKKSPRILSTRITTTRTRNAVRLCHWGINRITLHFRAAFTQRSKQTKIFKKLSSIT